MKWKHQIIAATCFFAGSNLLGQTTAPATAPTADAQHCHPDGSVKSGRIAPIARSDESAEQLLRDGREMIAAGQFGSAVEPLAESMKRFAGAGQAQRYCESALALSAAHSALGRQIKAMEIADEALLVAREYKEIRFEAILLGCRARAAMFSREADTAERDLLAARDLAQQVDDASAKLEISNDLGTLYASRGQTDLALQNYDVAAELARESSDAQAAELIAVNAALAAAEAGDASGESRADAARASLTAPDSGGYDKAHSLITLSDVFSKLADRNSTDAARHRRSSYESATAALRIGESQKNQVVIAHAWGRIAALYASGRQFDDALAAARKAVFFAQQARSADATFRFQWQLARLLRDRGEIDPAIAAYQRSLATLAAIRHDLAVSLGNQNSQKTFRQSIGPVFYEAADLLLRKADQLQDDSLRQESLKMACATIEELKSAELEDYFNDDCVNLIKAKARDIDVGLVNTAVVYLIPLADRTEVLLSTPQGYLRHQATVSEASLTAEVKQLRRLLEDEMDYSYRAPAANIYDWLIRPMESQLTAAGVDTLVFVPDGELRTIPMAALLDRQTQQHLIEKFAIAVSPGMRLVDSTPLARKRGVQLLAAGLSDAVQQFPSLPNVPAELQAINGLYGGVQLQNQQFLRPAFAERFRGDSFTIVHIASHGKFAGNAEDSYVLTYEDRLNLNDLEKLIQPSQFRGEPVELLTLSACQTAAGDDGARAALGLAGIAVKAGARSALASLWSVNDAASTQLFTAFYENLAKPESPTKAKSLQAAQVELLRQQNTRHPRYWAPYLILGNWK